LRRRLLLSRMVPGEPRRPHSRKTVQSPNMLESHGEAVASTIAEAAGRAPDDATVRAAMEVDAAYLKASSTQSRRSAARSTPISTRFSASGLPSATRF